MFMSRKNLVFSMLCLSSLLVCCQLQPMRGAPDMYGSYGMSLAKKDPSMSLKDSLISALLMTELPKAGTPSQRKKAVDSTFIRFGRSSASDSSNRTPSSAMDEDLPQEADYPRSSFPADGRSDISSKLTTALQSGCLIRSKSDLYMVLMGKSCSRASPKVKRENVNDTFIRFGKRQAPSSAEESPDIKYGR